MRTCRLIERMERRLERMDEHMAQGNELMDEIRREHRLNREEHRLNREEHRLNREAYERAERRHAGLYERAERRYAELHERSEHEYRLSRAAVENNSAVLRQLVLQGEEHRKILERIEQGIAAQTEGLMRVLDELRGGGPTAAGAG